MHFYAHNLCAKIHFSAYNLRTKIHFSAHKTASLLHFSALLSINLTLGHKKRCASRQTRFQILKTNLKLT